MKILKNYYNQDVYTSAKKRIEFILQEFEHIAVSFSGGKDSGVLLNLTLQVAKEKGLLNKIGVYHMDYEAQYQATTDYVKRTFDTLPKNVKKYWICLPVKVPCCTSMFQNYWQPWNFNEKEIWCRELPNSCINESNFNYGFDYDISDYEFNVKFGKALTNTYQKVCFLIGIRTQESLHRYKAVTKSSNNSEYKGKQWTTQLTNKLINAYPIYDWLVDDIWVANAKFNWDYNKLYDLFYQAGVPVNKMRVASPFISQGQDTLKLYKVIDPNNWGKLIGRVNGVNFTGLYGGTTAMGWKNIKKPKHFTWKTYMEFLLNTLPEDTRTHYIKKLNTSIKYWTVDGGALPKQIVNEIKIPHENLGEPKNKRHYTTKYEVIRFNDYLDEIDVSKPNLLPTYKRMCIAILKNDISCKTLGFGQTKAELEKRTSAIERYSKIF